MQYRVSYEINPSATSEIDSELTKTKWMINRSLNLQRKWGMAEE